jgi:hypothetical protein
MSVKELTLSNGLNLVFYGESQDEFDLLRCEEVFSLVYFIVEVNYSEHQCGLRSLTQNMLVLF